MQVTINIVPFLVKQLDQVLPRSRVSLCIRGVLKMMLEVLETDFNNNNKKKQSMNVS